MSGLDDFDVDEDFLRDIEEKEDLYFTQCTQANKRPRSISPKIVDRFDKEDDSSLKKFCSTNKGKETNAIEEKSSKKNLLLDILESESSIINEQTPLSSKLSTSYVEKTSVYHQAKNNQSDVLLSASKKLILDLIGEESSNIHQSYEKSSESQKPLKNLPVYDFNAKNRNNNVNKSKSNSKSLEKSYFRRSVNPQSQTQVFLTPELPKSVVRKFPGPAGLLPDDIKDVNDVDNEEIFEAIHNYNENHNPKNKTSPPNLCSQDTTKVFCDGAWQRMLDDLPTNFLKGYNIASIKRMNFSKKMPLLAAIIHKIDLNAKHPRIVLKDISDSIEGQIHRDIFMTYDDILKTGVVVLLQNVGILNYSGTQTSSTSFLVMISPVSILGIYSDTSRLVTTPALEEILKSNPNYQEQSKNCHNLRRSKAALLESLGVDSSISSTKPEFDDQILITSSSVEKIPRINFENNEISRNSSIPGGSRAQLLESLGIDLSKSLIKSVPNAKISSEGRQEIENIDPVDKSGDFDDSEDFRILNIDDDAFDSFSIDNANDIEASLIESKKDNPEAELLTEGQNESINNSTEEKNDQFCDSTENMSAGFADHLFNDNSDGVDDTDDIISQLDVEAFEK